MASNSSHILLIEDNLGDSTLIREHLADATDWQFEIYQATRLQEGIISLNNLIIDLVLLDLSLPDSRGLETFLSLHHQIPDVPG